MAKNALWSDEYWLMLMQLYLRKPVGVKPLYSKGLVELAIELHIPPKQLYERMFQLRTLDTPRMEKLWARYASKPRQLANGVKLLRSMKGFSNAQDFYEGVETVESWERLFRPIDGHDNLLPIALIIILDQYFRLTPLTMVEDTPEVKQLAELLKMKPARIVSIMEVFLACDPYLDRKEMVISDMLLPCTRIWKDYGNKAPEELAALAAQLKEYFR